MCGITQIVIVSRKRTLCGHFLETHHSCIIGLTRLVLNLTGDCIFGARILVDHNLLTRTCSRVTLTKEP